MYDIVRDSTLGYLLRQFSRGRLAPHRESLPDFLLRTEYWQPEDVQKQVDNHDNIPEHGDLPQAHQPSCEVDDFDSGGQKRRNGSLDPEAGPNYNQRKEIIVSWYEDSDPDDPHNWSPLKKGYVSFVILLYTFTVYIGTSMYTASIPDIVNMYHIPQVIGSLGLSLYVLGYGVAPLILSPLSEIPSIGRNIPYIITFFLLFILCIPMALVDNIPGLLVLRFLLGFFGSPALSTGGASYGDFYGAKIMPYVITFWGCGATLGPALGPLVGGFSVQAKTWRWSSWELLWLSGFTLFLMLVSLPETSSDNILLRRAQRLRARTGCLDLKSASEFKQAKLSPRQVVFDALIKPWQINILDPAVLFTTIYTALIYGIYYSFFEAFPLVYGDEYGFNLGQIGLAFLSVLVGLVLAMMLYCSYFYFYADAKMASMQVVPPEARLWPGLVATFFIPAGLIIFAWTARSSVHWIVSLIGVGLSMMGVFVITQCMFIYLPFTYAQYSGSLFAANGFARALFAAGAISYARPMFDTLGIDGAVSLLAGLTVICVFGMYFIYFYGARLRKRSRFAVS
ncbi:hypothetical protein LTS17_000189 [Exophiala oligosperma]